MPCAWTPPPVAPDRTRRRLTRGGLNAFSKGGAADSPRRSERAHGASKVANLKKGQSRGYRISRAISRTCDHISPVHINEMFDEGQRLIAAGADDYALDAGLIAFCQQLNAGGK
jgi:hypothetical protein